MSNANTTTAADAEALAATDVMVDAVDATVDTALADFPFSAEMRRALLLIAAGMTSAEAAAFCGYADAGYVRKTATSARGKEYIALVTDATDGCLAEVLAVARSIAAMNSRVQSALDAAIDIFQAAQDAADIIGSYAGLLNRFAVPGIEPISPPESWAADTDRWKTDAEGGAHG